MVNSYFALGYKCNHNCINCPLSTFDRLHGQLNQKVIQENVNNLVKNGDDLHVTISGGEPTLHPEFLNVLGVLGESNAFITVLSNGTRCADMSFVDLMIDSLGEEYDFNRFKYITAIHSNRSEIHDLLTGVEGSFKESISGIKNLDSRHLNIMIKHIMNKKSLSSMKDLVNFVTDFYSNNVGLQFCSMDFSGRCRKNVGELYASNDIIGPYLEESLDEFERKKDNCGRRLEIIETPLCIVDPYYWKYYCLSGLGKLEYIAPNEESENNRSTITSSCHTNYLECQDCDVKSYCDGVWESTYEIEKDKSKVLQKVKVII